jgi:hypothetical protein
MWERATGVPATGCRNATGNLQPVGSKSLPLGVSATALLYLDGQPASRPGSRYVYCVSGSPRANITAVIGASGNAVAYTTTATGYRAGGVRPGSAATSIEHATRIAPGVWRSGSLSHGARYVYGVRSGRVRYVGLLAKTVNSTKASLLATLHQAGLR